MILDFLRSLKYLTRSLIFWIIVELVCIEFLIDYTKPLSFVTDIELLPLSKNPVVAKSRDFINSNIHPDIIVFGSSQPMAAIVRSDFKHFGHPNVSSDSEFRTYLGAQYLAQLSSSNARLTAMNATTVSGMVSDIHLLLTRGVETDKWPKIAVIGISQRDFCDNLARPVGKTPPYEVLQDWKTIHSLLGGNVSLSERLDLIISAVSHMYRDRKEYTTVISQWFCRQSGHPLTLYQAKNSGFKNRTIVNSLNLKSNSSLSAHVSERKQLNTKNEQEMQQSLDGYRKRYSPPNLQRFDQELIYFNKIIEYSKNHNIRLVVVNMPLIKNYRSIIPTVIQIKYDAALASFASQSFGTLIDLERDPIFANSDFTDCCHLNESGADKWIHRVAPIVRAQLNDSVKVR